MIGNAVFSIAGFANSIVADGWLEWRRYCPCIAVVAVFKKLTFDSQWFIAIDSARRGKMIDI